MSAEAVGWVFRHSPYPGGVRIVHLAIADSVNDQHEHEFWMSMGSLAAKTGMSRYWCSQVVARLVDDGYLYCLTRGGGRGLTSHYRFVFKRQETANSVGTLLSAETANSVAETANKLPTPAPKTANCVGTIPIDPKKIKDPKEERVQNLTPILRETLPRCSPLFGRALREIAGRTASSR